ncbi:MBL fold metallo-hydrolase [Georgenia thermotolerans]|uniref:MBL fold metallo-hydrolase n=1 Tax=Georgenia thermotolerans TaxID=527326 RepID=A0A7J5UNE6_9MICO|nr:MBL fold metallo-hydrolase [Georgenia thermotolerans]KAE8763624.1 MBL fold metallo-hydrolase [Georgenia thermotolerans]
MRLTVVGCSGSMSGPASAASCYLVQADGPDAEGRTRTWSVVLDLGPGAMGALMNHVDPAAVDVLALSHLHADHMVDIIGMQVYRRWHPDGALDPLPVHAPAGALERVRGVGGDPAEEDYAGQFRFLEHAPGRVVQVGPMRLQVFPVRHPVPAYGIRVTGPSDRGAGEVSLAYTGDTDSCDGLVDLARDADLLLSEAAFQEGRDTVRGIHLTGRRAGEVAAAAGVRRLVLTHLQPWTDPEVVRAEAHEVYAGPVDLAAPGATWTL